MKKEFNIPFLANLLYLDLHPEWKFKEEKLLLKQFFLGVSVWIKKVFSLSWRCIIKTLTYKYMDDHSEKLGVLGMTFAVVLVIIVSLAYTFLAPTQVVQQKKPVQAYATTSTQDQNGTGGMTKVVNSNISTTSATTSTSSSSMTGNTLTWDQAVSALQKGEVTAVTQNNDTVTLTFKDGSMFYTKEPQKDAIFSVLDSCSNGCGVKTIETE